MRTEKHGFRIIARHPAAIISMAAFALCIPTQILGYAHRLNEPLIAVPVVFLTVLSAVLMIVMTLKFGQKALWVSIFPVVIGVLGFAFKLFIDPREGSLLHHISAAVLYAAIIVIWSLTVLYIIRTKWLLVILFLVPFLKHVMLNDLPVLLGTADPVSVSTWMKELCMLFFMLAMTFSAMSFEKASHAEYCRDS